MLEDRIFAFAEFAFNHFFNTGADGYVSLVFAILGVTFGIYIGWHVFRFLFWFMFCFVLALLKK